MASLLRLPTDRLSRGFGKRFSALSMTDHSNSSDSDGRDSAFHRSLPSIQQLDNDDFLTMFDGPLQSPPKTNRTSSRLLPAFELDGSVPASEFHGTPIMDRGGLRHVVHRKPVPSERHQTAHVSTDSAPTSCRSGLTSTNPSFRTSHTTSTVLRNSSVSSMADEISSSERSSKESESEGVRHVSRASRTHGKSSLSRTPVSPKPVTMQSSKSPKSPGRGKRLGEAMTDGVPTSPRPSMPVYHTRKESIPSTPHAEIFSTQIDSDIITSASRARRALGRQAPDSLDNIRVGIMAQLDNLEDLINCALISKDFYSAYVRYEAYIVESVVKRQSIFAWELRRSITKSDRSGHFRMRPVLRDYSTIRALLDFIGWTCQSSLRPQTREALLGNMPARKVQLEDALWQIWTFCNIFGKTSSIDVSISKQIQWLEGKYKRTTKKALLEPQVPRAACTMVELEDISEMWRCLETLLSGFKGREAEARGYGMFDNSADLQLTDRELLDLWIADILSLGPKAVLTLSSCDFEQANVLGITRWTPPTKIVGRTKFLKAAVEEVYRDRLVKQARQKALDYRKSIQHHHKRTTSDPYARHTLPLRKASPTSITGHLPRIETKKIARQSMPISSASQWQSIGSVMSEVRPDCDPLSPIAQNQPLSISPATNPGSFSSLSMTQSASVKLGPTLFPMQNRDQSQRPAISSTVSEKQHEQLDECPQDLVVDPSDKALELMVQGMGYSANEARRALMLSDTGSGIDVQTAVGLLSSDETTIVQPKLAVVCELPAPTGNARLTPRPVQKQTCQSSCKPLMLVEPKRERVTGLGIVKRGLSYRLSMRKGMKLSVIPDEDENPVPSISPLMTSHCLVPEEPALKPSPQVSAMSTSPRPAVLTDIKKYANAEELRLSTDSPVSPIHTDDHEWLGKEFAPVKDIRVQATRVDEMVEPRPRIALQRVGTGMKKQSWTLPGRKRKEQIIEPEIIGYVY